jgi:hypothetical protein
VTFLCSGPGDATSLYFLPGIPLGGRSGSSSCNVPPPDVDGRNYGHHAVSQRGLPRSRSQTPRCRESFNNRSQGRRSSLPNTTLTGVVPVVSSVDAL